MGNLLANRLMLWLAIAGAALALSWFGVDLWENSTAQMVCAGLLLVVFVLAIVPSGRKPRP